MKKILVIAILMFGFLAAQNCNAGFDGFETYQLGADLAGQGIWTGVTTTNSLTVDWHSFQGTQSVKGIGDGTDYAQIALATTSNGQISFKYLVNATTTPGYAMQFIIDGFNSGFGIYVDGSPAKVSIIDPVLPKYYCSSTLFDVWQDFAFEWHGGTEWRISCDGGYNWTEFATTTANLEDIKYFRISAGGSTGQITGNIDNLQYGEIITLPAMDTMEIAPIYPADCEWNQLGASASGTLDFYSTGIFVNPEHLENGEENHYTFNTLKINFYTAGGNTTTTEIALSGLAPNSAFSWAENISLLEDDYRVDYLAEGYNAITGEAFNFSHYCPGTGIGPNAPSTGFDWWGAPVACTYDDCTASSTNILETIACNGVNFAKGIVCPSPQALQKALAIVNEMKSKFPYNYIIATRNILSTTSNDIASSTATSTLSGNLNDYAGTASLLANTSNGVNLLAYVRALLLGLLIFAFGIISYKSFAEQFFS